MASFIRFRPLTFALVALTAGAFAAAAWSQTPAPREQPQRAGQGQRTTQPQAAPSKPTAPQAGSRGRTIAPAAAPAPQAATGPTIDTSARQAIIVDFRTGAVLYEKNADERMAPSSMSKIMTGYLVFKAIKDGRMSLTDTLPVSQRAWRMGGSKMFVALGSRVKVEDLLRGMIVQSGNDACIVLAEGLAGSEEAFAEQMNEEGKRLGLTNSNFRNASGWPDPEHYMSARDLATLARTLITDHPEFYKLYSELTFTYGTDAKGSPIQQGNRNPLLYKSIGADGIKTGHTETAGYGLTASATREGRRVIVVVNGMASARARAEESERLVDWAFREYGNFTIFKAGQSVEKAEVWMGDKPFISLVAAQDLTVTLPRRLRQQMKVTAVYDSPVPAPVAKGAPIGKVVIAAPGVEIVELQLVAGEDAARLGFGGRVVAGLGQLLFGKK